MVVSDDNGTIGFYHFHLDDLIQEQTPFAASVAKTPMEMTCYTNLRACAERGGALTCIIQCELWGLQASAGWVNDRPFSHRKEYKGPSLLPVPMVT